MEQKRDRDCIYNAQKMALNLCEHPSDSSCYCRHYRHSHYYNRTLFAKVMLKWRRVQYIHCESVKLDLFSLEHDFRKYCKRVQYIHCESEKLDPFSFKHNFGTYCPILIILSLLQTEINCDQAYSKSYHHTLHLLVHYPIKWTRMYLPTLLAWFHN